MKLKKSTNPSEIYRMEDIRTGSKIEYIISQIKTFDSSELKEFILTLINNISNETIKKTEFRKLFMAYSLLEKTP